VPSFDVGKLKMNFKRSSICELTGKDIVIIGSDIDLSEKYFNNISDTAKERGVPIYLKVKQ
jgi:hypothetical protein